MCGEHQYTVCPKTSAVRSSLHVRGALAKLEVVEHRVGIIPACAGSTFGTTGVPYCAMGSSPHVRGARASSPFGYVTTGIIPACAGSTSARWCATSCAGDHPRMCGEHLLRRYDRPRHQGIIPACAGSTRPRCAPCSQSRDHPRMYGEHGAATAGGSGGVGSSPHVRGAPNEQTADGEARGIIPACAGSTVQKVPRANGARDHPRMCGEHWMARNPADSPVGSSPHVRGAHGNRHGHSRWDGIIPACAGSTSDRFGGFPYFLGSSPHVRGALTRA